MSNNKCFGTYACPICTDDFVHSHELTKKWIGVDFDNTLATDTTDRTDPYILGEPIEAMVFRVKDWIAKGYWVKIFTSRMNPYSYTTGKPRDLEKMEKCIKQWCIKHLGKELECTAMKDGLLEVIWDDRAVRVIKDKGIPKINNPNYND